MNVMFRADMWQKQNGLVYLLLVLVNSCSGH